MAVTWLERYSVAAVPFVNEVAEVAVTGLERYSVAAVPFVTGGTLEGTTLFVVLLEDDKKPLVSKLNSY